MKEILNSMSLGEKLVVVALLAIFVPVIAMIVIALVTGDRDLFEAVVMIVAAV